MIKIMASPLIHFIAYTGAVFIYCNVQLNIWWLAYATVILTMLTYPLRCRVSIINLNRTKYIHYLIAAIGLVVPILSPVAVLSSDLNAMGLVLCKRRGYGENNATMFYASDLPLSLLISAGMTVTSLIFLQLHKVN